MQITSEVYVAQTDKQADRQTNKQRRKHNLLGGGKNDDVHGSRRTLCEGLSPKEIPENGMRTIDTLFIPSQSLQLLCRPRDVRTNNER